MLPAHIRSFLARHRAIHWSLVALAAFVVAASLVSQASALERERRAWGTTRTVWVADGDVVAGTAVTARPIDAPLALVPADALTEDPVGTDAWRDLADGEVLTGRSVRGPGDRMAEGRRGVAIGADETTLPVRVGDRVDVVADGAVIATDGVVTEVTAASVVVAVAEASAASVASAALDRLAVLVLRG